MTKPPDADWGNTFLRLCDLDMVGVNLTVILEMLVAFDDNAQIKCGRNLNAPGRAKI
jgi:hypothetical protein